MQPMRAALLLLAGLHCVLGGRVEANPLSKVLDLIKGLIAKVEDDGDKADKAYREYFEWCDNVAKETNFAISSAATEKEKLEAKIGELTSRIEVASTKIDELAGSISSGDEELKKSTAIREQEAAEFQESEKELEEAADALDRAVAVLEKEMKAGSSFAQLDTATMENLLTGLGAVLNAASFSSKDRDHLEALLQAQDAEEDGAVGAPTAAAYKSHSGGILDVLEDMKEKAETQLGDARKAEATAQNNYQLLKQSLEDQLAADNGDLAEEKSAKAAAEEGRATAKGELEVTAKELGHAKQELETAQSTCMTTGADHEQSVAARKEEHKVLKEALKILQETTGDAAEQQGYSFMQVSSESAAGQGERIVGMVKKLAERHHSLALSQLASRMTAAIKYGEDPFGKVRGLIQDMIAKLEKEAESEATEKAYCDEELKKTGAKKSDLEDEVASMTTKIDQAMSRSAELKEMVQELQKEIATIIREQAEMDKIRSDENAAYQKAKADLEAGIGGVRKALKVLRDYYAQDKEKAFLQQDNDRGDDANFGAFMQQPEPPKKFEKSGGAGSGIIGILEVTESDFATTLAKLETEEADAVSEYGKMAQENKVAVAAKEKDVKYKTQESKSLAKSIAEVSTDRDDSNTELSAVTEYWEKLKDRCIAAPDTYQERMKRRAAEIEGLKEALTVLEDETAFLQRKRAARRHRRARMRGALEAQ